MSRPGKIDRLRCSKRENSEKSGIEVTDYSKLRQHKWLLLLPGLTAAISEATLSYNQSVYLPAILGIFLKMCSPLSLMSIYSENLLDIDKKFFDVAEFSFFGKRETRQRREFSTQTEKLKKTISQLPDDVVSNLHKQLLEITQGNDIQVSVCHEAEAGPNERSHLLSP